MKIAIVGLGKMGLNMATRLTRQEIAVVGFDIAPPSTNELPTSNFELANSLEDVIVKLAPPRVIWLMLPSGANTENAINQISILLSPGDLVIDGANSNYRDSQRRGKVLISKGLKFLDVGVSGGLRGLNDGYCIMIGGEKSSLAPLKPILNALAVDRTKGWSHLGPQGAGHFAKMIHNGIEYGMMQSIVEGLELTQSKTEFSIDIKKMTELWLHGSVIRSWLLDLLCQGLDSKPNFEEIISTVADSGEGRWFAIEAIEQGVSTPVIAQALNMRLLSQTGFDFGFKLLSIMRNTFGGHKVPGIKK